MCPVTPRMVREMFEIPTSKQILFKQKNLPKEQCIAFETHEVQ
jgi:hypothetical protein